MDPISHALTGAAFAGLFAPKGHRRAAMVVAGLAAMAPDLDVVIRSSSDPLLALEYHRNFTHGLGFVPVGALICAAFFWLFPATRRRLRFWPLLNYSFLGYLTHAPLDACTSYGTRIFWPFSQARVAWDSIAIVDLFYTLPLLVLVVMGYRHASRRAAGLAVGWLLAYLALGFYQHHRTYEAAERYVKSRGGEPALLTVRPTLSNLWVWRAIYRQGDDWRMAGVYDPFWKPGTFRFYPGDKAAMVTEEELRKLPAGSLLGQDVRRFAFFADGYLGQFATPQGARVYGDVRYAALPTSALPLWAIGLPEDCLECHATRLSLSSPAAMEGMNRLLLGDPLPASHLSGQRIETVTPR